MMLEMGSLYSLWRVVVVNHGVTHPQNCVIADLTLFEVSLHRKHKKRDITTIQFTKDFKTANQPRQHSCLFTL